jgi:hypothetical protein
MFVVLYKQPFMIVRPVNKLMTSNTLRNAVAQGDWPVVNMITGEFTIYTVNARRADERRGYPRKVYDTLAGALKACEIELEVPFTAQHTMLHGTPVARVAETGQGKYRVEYTTSALGTLLFRIRADNDKTVEVVLGGKSLNQVKAEEEAKRIRELLKTAFYLQTPHGTSPLPTTSSDAVVLLENLRKAFTTCVVYAVRDGFTISRANLTDDVSWSTFLKEVQRVYKTAKQ